MNNRGIIPGGGISGKIIQHNDIFEKIISLENLFLAWREFCRGKRKKVDVQEFEINLENNIFKLHNELKNFTYQHSQYTTFSVRDPKLRQINKAIVRDRVLHHAIFRVLCPIFDKNFIFDSYSCRTGKGVHLAVKRLGSFLRKSSENNHKNIFVLKCDIRKFFDSINQEILLEIIKKKVEDKKTLWLLEKIINSFEKEKNTGLPLGNVTSQLFANIYMNELDQFMKHALKARFYLRYSDDFIVISERQEYLKNLIVFIEEFLRAVLKLKLHEDKIIIRKYRQGIDFLGYVIFPGHLVLRTKTKRRIMRKISQGFLNLEEDLISAEYFDQSLQAYLGMLKHCSGHGIKKEIGNLFASK